MVNRNEQVGTYNQTVGVKLDMDEAIHILTPHDVPLQQWLPSDSTNVTKVEWLEEDLMGQSITIDTAVASTASPWTINVVDASEVRPGDVLHIRGRAYDIQFLVDSVNTTTNDVVVSSFGATAATDDPVNGDVLDIIGQYRNEGSDPELPRSNERAAKYNVTQFGQESVQATRTARTRGAGGGLYGQGDPYDHEVAKKYKELAVRWERSAVSGVRSVSGDSKKRFMGGLLYYITTNSTSGVKANIKTLLSDLIQESYDAGGTPNVLMVSPAIKRIVSETVDPTLRQSTRTTTEGGFVIDSYMSDFGTLDLTANRHFPRTKGIALQREFLAQVKLDPYFHELLAKTGDAEKGHIVGESTLRVKNEKAMGVLTVTDA